MSGEGRATFNPAKATVRVGEIKVGEGSLEYTVASHKGKRKYMEDFAEVKELDVKDESIVSRAASKRMARIFKDSCQDETEVDYESALQRAYCALDKELSTLQTPASWGSCCLPSALDYYCGSTGVTVVLSPSTITVAHIGDSRAMIAKSRQLELVTTDHTLAVEEELERARSTRTKIREGCITSTEQLGNYVKRHHLTMTRALGDFAYKLDYQRDVNEQTVIALPDTVTLERSAEDEFLLVASDGLWTYMSNEEVVEFVVASLLTQGQSARECCMGLLTECAKRRSLDNITILLVPLNR